ncbi:MAG: vWA domain-containing protein, partial [Acidimicrobiales bacterium]
MSQLGGSSLPGGGISTRPLHLILLADCSGSMATNGGERIQALNFAVASMLPHLAAWELEQGEASVLVRVLAFAAEPVWHLGHPTPVGEVRWKRLQVVEGERGWRTNFGAALSTAADVLSPANLERRALRPALVLITDGQASDASTGGYDVGLAALDAVPAGRSALRVAVAIGDEPDTSELTRFVGNGDVPVLRASRVDEIADHLVAVSIAVSRMSESGVDRRSVAQGILGPR